MSRRRMYSLFFAASMRFVSSARTLRLSMLPNSSISSLMVRIFSRRLVSSTLILLSSVLILSSSARRFARSCSSRACVLAELSMARSLKERSSCISAWCARDGRWCWRSSPLDMCSSRRTLICSIDSLASISFFRVSGKRSMNSLISWSRWYSTSYLCDSPASPLRSSMSVARSAAVFSSRRTSSLTSSTSRSTRCIDAVSSLTLRSSRSRASAGSSDASAASSRAAASSLLTRACAFSRREYSSRHGSRRSCSSKSWMLALSSSSSRWRAPICSPSARFSSRSWW
mmetsp:Transcript_21333/g.75176  ORF Transcript_21333/g.75176 Transcript_21333/m.75176 type:complete len:286 (+) Transcript_21333:794-1651(+)